MSKESNSKKTVVEHFIPNFLLKRWAEDEKLLIVNPTLGKKIINFRDNKRYFASDSFYENPEKYKENELENALGYIEQRYAELTDKITKKYDSNEEHLTEDEVALFKTFTTLQLFRTKDYQEAWEKDRKKTIDKLLEYVNSYKEFTQLSMDEKQKRTDEVINKLIEVTEKYSDDFDKREYYCHQIMYNPKYHLVYLVDFLYSVAVIKFEDDILPLSEMGEFKLSKNGDEAFVYLCPFRPNMAFVTINKEMPEVGTNAVMEKYLRDKLHRRLLLRQEGYQEMAWLNATEVFPMSYKDFDLMKEYEYYNENTIIGARGSKGTETKNSTRTNKDKKDN